MRETTTFEHADSVYVEEDEGRFQLHVWAGDDHMIFDIHADALKFYENVVREIRPWFLEAEHARQAVNAGVSLKAYTGAAEDQDDGYALDDPKHPTYHDRMVGDA